jgi:hypothetical protein
VRTTLIVSDLVVSVSVVIVTDLVLMGVVQKDSIVLILMVILIVSLVTSYPVAVVSQSVILATTTHVLLDTLVLVDSVSNFLVIKMENVLMIWNVSSDIVTSRVTQLIQTLVLLDSPV